MDIEYFPICKLTELDKEGSLAHTLINGGPLTCNARRTTDGFHVVFAGMAKDPVPPYIFDSESPAVEQTEVLKWLEGAENEHALWVTLPQLIDLDAAELFGPISLQEL